jgi:hypothetical protein
MTTHSFVLILVVGSAVLAFWLGARFPEFGPQTLTYGLFHILCGYAAIRAIPSLTDAIAALPAGVTTFLTPFGITLPLFTYTFLTGLWLTRLIHRSISGMPD